MNKNSNRVGEWGHAPLDCDSTKTPTEATSQMRRMYLDVHDRLLKWCRNGEEIHNGSKVRAKGDRQYARASSMVWSYHVDHPRQAFGWVE
jgi:hypothetical protein